MMENRVRYIFFAGIGGIGMSGLAQYCIEQDYIVLGYDKNKSQITEKLSDFGAQIFYDEFLAVDFLNDISKDNIRIIITPALKKDSHLIAYLYDNYNSTQIQKRAEFLAEISSKGKCLAVAGTHGKTSTCTLLAYMLKDYPGELYAFLGGVSTNFESNYIHLEPQDKNLKTIYIVEADEYDRSFLQLKPTYAVITAIEPDHLEIYNSEEGVYEGFNQFAKLAEKLFINKNFEKFLNDYIIALTYGLSNDSDITAKNIEIKDNKYIFSVNYQDLNIPITNFNLLGKHNIENFLAAFSLATCIMQPSEVIQNLQDYKGVVRRLEYLFQSKNVIYIDDYAHHPTEIEVTLQTLSELYQGYKIIAIFQPHLFSRTQDFQNEFASALSLANELILLPIYPARELPIQGVTSEIIANKVSISNRVVDKDNLISTLTMKVDKNTPTVLITLGAGDIDSFREPIKAFCNQ